MNDLATSARFYVAILPLKGAISEPLALGDEGNTFKLPLPEEKADNVKALTLVQFPAVS